MKKHIRDLTIKECQKICDKVEACKDCPIGNFDLVERHCMLDYLNHKIKWGGLPTQIKRDVEFEPYLNREVEVDEQRIRSAKRIKTKH